MAAAETGQFHGTALCGRQVELRWPGPGRASDSLLGPRPGIVTQAGRSVTGTSFNPGLFNFDTPLSLHVTAFLSAGRPPTMTRSHDHGRPAPAQGTGVKPAASESRSGRRHGHTGPVVTVARRDQRPR